MGQRTAWKADSCTAELSPEPPGSIRIGDATAASPPHDGRPDSPVAERSQNTSPMMASCFGAGDSVAAALMGALCGCRTR